MTAPRRIRKDLSRGSKYYSSLYETGYLLRTVCFSSHSGGTALKSTYTRAWHGCFIQDCTGRKRETLFLPIL